MAVDGQGNAIVGGMAGGQEFPLKNPLYGTFSEPWLCGFLSSIAPQGSTLNFSTFILEQRVIALVLDDRRDIYLATMDNSILKISGDGQRLLYKYKMPFSDSNDVVTSIAVTADGSLVVAGWTTTWNFPTRHPVQAAPGGKADAFILKINPQGDDLEFATRLGGAEDDLALDVALGADGSIYVCGLTASADFPLKNAADACPERQRGCLRRPDRSGSTASCSIRPTWAGIGKDKAMAMALDGAGAAYLCRLDHQPRFPGSRRPAGQAGRREGPVRHQAERRRRQGPAFDLFRRLGPHPHCRTQCAGSWRRLGQRHLPGSRRQDLYYRRNL